MSDGSTPATRPLTPHNGSSDLPVSSPERAVIGRAVIGSLLLGALFVGFDEVTKALRVLYAHGPWKEDPYDALVSFAIVAGTLLTGACAVRVLLCRASEALPARRAVDLLRAGRLIVALVAVTVASDWASVGLQTRRQTWTAVTALIVAGLAVLTLLTGVVGMLLHRATREAQPFADAPTSPDWAADGVEFCDRAAARLGRWGTGLRSALRMIDAAVVGRIRRHPVVAAAVFAVVFGMLVDVPQVILEDYAFPLAALVMTISACSMFAFVVLAGAYVHLVGRRQAHLAPTVVVLLSVCVSVPLVASFRGSLWWLIHTKGSAAGLPQFAELLGVGAVIAAVVSGAAIAVVGHRPPKRAVAH